MKNLSQEEMARGDKYGMESMKWYGWGSPIGLSIFFLSIGLLLCLLHLANIIK